LGSVPGGKLDFSWDEVHEIAEQLEHIKSEKLINKLMILEILLKIPHGDPIPNAEILKLISNYFRNWPRIKKGIVGVDIHQSSWKYLDKESLWAL
jgi:DtxR family Mn-dependent transcriptional regulator